MFLKTEAMAKVTLSETSRCTRAHTCVVIKHAIGFWSLLPFPYEAQPKWLAPQAQQIPKLAVLSNVLNMKYTSLEDTYPKEAPTTPGLHTSQRGECLCASLPSLPKMKPIPLAPSASPHLDNRQATVQEAIIDMITLELSNGYQHSRVELQTL